MEPNIRHVGYGVGHLVYQATETGPVRLWI